MRPLAYGAMVGALAAGLAAAPVAAQTATATLAPSTLPAVPAYPSAALAAWYGLHRQFVARAALGHVSLLFLGDSITANWMTVGRDVWNYVFAPRGAANFGIGGDKTQNLLWRIQNGELDGINPKTIVLMIGTNNLGDGPQAVVDGVNVVVQALRTREPQATIRVLSVPPVTGGTVGPFGAEIGAINHALTRLDDGRHVLFTDLTPYFTNSDGSQKAVFYQPDKLHLSLLGYEAIGFLLSKEL